MQSNCDQHMFKDYVCKKYIAWYVFFEDGKVRFDRDLLAIVDYFQIRYKINTILLMIIPFYFNT